MRKLSKSTLEKISSFMNNSARTLEKALFEHYFINANDSAILSSLEKFQNTDGGFGNGIEPDFQLPSSSPMATSIGLKYLSMLPDSDEKNNRISAAIHYLENIFDSERKGWFSVSKEVNNYPHAPWWDFKPDINMTVIDYSWGNPTAELSGYLNQNKPFIKKLDIDDLTNRAVQYFKSLTDFTEHEVYCFIRMHNSVDKKIATQLSDTLKIAVSQLVKTEESEWEKYVPTPLNFIEFDSTNYFDIEQDIIDKNLNYLIDKLESDGKISPTWQWDKYADEWEIAKTEWTAILTLQALLSLLKFNRI